MPTGADTTTDSGEMLPPLQIEFDSGCVTMLGAGFTVITYVEMTPIQFPRIGVIEYITVPTVNPLFTMVCIGMVLLVPDVIKPEIPVDAVAFHEYFVALTLDFNGIESVGIPEQTV